jgi:hypothetical protein
MFMFSSPVEGGERPKNLRYMQLTQETLGRVGTGERSLPSRIGVSYIETQTPERSASTF